MNKKVIKYLIWTILLAAILILMPVKETKAVIVTYDTFKQSQNHFCLNKGKPFHASESFTASDITGSTFTFPDNNGKSVDVDVLKYIISESDTGAYGDRSDIGNYIPQIAIWELAGSSLNNSSADRLIANAYAYNNFPSNAPEPKIVKNGDTIEIYYNRATSSGDYGNGTYNNVDISSISFEGVEYYDDVSCDVDGYNRKRIYIKNSGVTQATISFKYETLRNASLQLYTSSERISSIIELQNNTSGTINTGTYFLKIGNSYRCYTCSGTSQLNELKKLTLAHNLDAFLSSWAFVAQGAKESIKTEITSGLAAGMSYYYCGEKEHNHILKVNGNQYTILKNYMGSTESRSLTAVTTNTSSEKPQNLLYGTGSISTLPKEDTIKFIQPVTLNFNKKDFNGNNVTGATLSISKVDNVDTLSTTSITIGSGSVTVMPANSNSGTFKIKLSESAPAAYKGIPDTTLTISYNNGAVTGITSSNTTYVPNSSNKNVTIKNKPKVNLIINKTDALTGAKLANARFKIELTNVESMKDYQIPEVKKGETQNSPTLVYVKTDSNGQIKLTGIVPTGGKGTITVKITEVEVPTANGYYYKLLENPITVTMTYNNDGTWTETGVGSISGNTLTVGIQNQPYITLSGMVWNDGQTGEKGNVSDANGQKDPSEANLQGIIVQLYSIKDNKVISTTTTNANGNYSFTDIPKTNEGYKIIFKYNGITYVETPTGTISKPAEVNRTTFNNRFKTISAGKSNDNTALGYTYNSGNKTSALNATIDGHTTGTTDAKFQMSAQTSTYLNTATDVSCGLVKKNFDLAIGTDVKEAELTINDKTTKYTYAEIMNGVLNFQNSSSSKEDVIYNLYLYSSDYNYRIKDYKTDVKGNNVPDNDNNNIADYDNIKDLEAYVTYSVILKSQTTNVVTLTSTVEEFVYYYDTSVYSPEFSVNDVIDGYKVKSIEGNKIIFESADSNNALSEGNSYRKEINLTFRINKKDGSLVVKENTTNIVEITKYSTSEGGLIDKDSAPANGITNGKITQYEDDTDEAKGLNIVLRNDETRTITGTVFDDKGKDGIKNNSDTTVDGVIVQLIEIKKIGGQYYEYIWQETISGSNQVKTTARNGYEGTTYTNSVQTGSGKYEFKDFIPGNYIIRYIYGDGTKKIAGQILENSEPVKNTTVELYSVTKNTVEKSTTTNENGNYEFKDYTPGEYKIRYQYEGTVKEITANESEVYTGSQKKYNGQDYKSTKDPNYQELWYNTSNYSTGASIARDNEARRLEVMANTYVINGSNEFDLNKTWMCAETSRINIPVDDVEDAKAKTAANETDTTTASYQYTADGDIVLFGDMNFGLALRPNTNIALEKHITALKITPSGTGVQSIVDAKAKGKDGKEAIESIVNGDVVEVEGATEGLATIKSTIDNRGFWQVATDVEELMQGAELEVEYTYVLRNDSDEDYLSKTLVEAYENQDVKAYNEVLNEIVNNTIKPSMRSGVYSYKLTRDGDKLDIGTYLGQFYYTGTKGANDTLVSSRVESFEEALNNDFAFDESNSISFKKVNTTGPVAKKVYGVDKENGTKEVQIETVVKNTTVSTFLKPELDTTYEKDTADWSRTIKLTTTLATVSGGEMGANLPSYIAEILQYSNAAGRRNMNATPDNLSYVHSDDKEMTMANSNESDEFWAESIIITKPTGEDKLTPIQIVIITISSVAVLGVGIVLIKKFVLKK